MNTGAKHDSGKVRAALPIQDFPRALVAVAWVSTFGAEKYAAHSWLNIPNASERYEDAFHRHILAQASGEVNDPESGLPHAAHVAWNALALLELQLRRKEEERTEVLIEGPNTPVADAEPSTPASARAQGPRSV